MKNGIKEVGRQTASHWLQASLNGSPEQVGNQIEVLKEAAIHILGTYAFNSTKKECYENPLTESEIILQLRQEIEEEIEFMKNNTNIKDFKELK